MSRWPNAFFMMAAVCIMVGTSWGLYMSVTHDFATAPAHAHLNLLGFVSLSIMGAFYATLGKTTPRWLIKTNFFLNSIGVVIMITGLWLLFTQRAPIEKLIPLMMISEPMIILGFLSFFTAVVLSFRRKPDLAATA